MSFFDRKEVKDVFAYLNFFANTHDEISLSRILKVPNKGITKSTVEKLEDLAGQYCLMQSKKSEFYARMLKSQMTYLKEYKDWRDMAGRFGHGRTPTYVDKVLAALDKMGVK